MVMASNLPIAREPCLTGAMCGFGPQVQLTQIAWLKFAAVRSVCVKSNPPFWLISAPRTAPVKSAFCMSVALSKASLLP